MNVLRRDFVVREPLLVAILVLVTILFSTITHSYTQAYDRRRNLLGQQWYATGDAELQKNRPLPPSKPFAPLCSMPPGIGIIASASPKPSRRPATPSRPSTTTRVSGRSIHKMASLIFIWHASPPAPGRLPTLNATSTVPSSASGRKMQMITAANHFSNWSTSISSGETPVRPNRSSSFFPGIFPKIPFSMPASPTFIPKSATTSARSRNSARPSSSTPILFPLFMVPARLLSSWETIAPPNPT